MEAIKKLSLARAIIKNTKLEKMGWNPHSKYKYFTPEQIGDLTSNQDFGLFNKFDLVRTEYGLVAKLSVIDMESDKSVDFQIATEIASMTATNAAQQLGGAVTYSERYLLQIAYGIKDNTLDFDANKPVPQKAKTVKKEELTPDHEGWDKAIDYLSKAGTMKKIKEKYIISDENAEALILASELRK